MRPIIEFCTNNMHHGTEQVMRRLEQNPDYDVIAYDCLGNCDLCSIGPYALVNGEIVAASDPDALYESILAKIKEQEDAFAWLDEL